MYKALYGLVIPITIAATGAAATPAEDASTRIEEGMTVEQVNKSTGFEPNVVEEKQCGDDFNIPHWTCRIQTYSDGAHTLMIYFRQLNDRPTWVVRSWQVR